MYYRSLYRSPIGMLNIISNEHNILGVWFEGETLYLYGLGDCEITDGNTEPLKAAAQWLDQYFAGMTPDTEGLPLDPQGTDFQKCVWELLKKIPYGTCVTYGQLAKLLSEANSGKRMSAQAVGQAVGHNPISIILPCHRVLGSGNKLTGYAGGLERKRWLLNHERIHYKE